MCSASRESLLSLLGTKYCLESVCVCVHRKVSSKRSRKKMDESKSSRSGPDKITQLGQLVCTRTIEVRRNEAKSNRVKKQTTNDYRRKEKKSFLKKERAGTVVASVSLVNGDVCVFWCSWSNEMKKNKCNFPMGLILNLD